MTLWVEKGISIDRRGGGALLSLEISLEKLRIISPQLAQLCGPMCACTECLDDKFLSPLFAPQRLPAVQEPLKNRAGCDKRVCSRREHWRKSPPSFPLLVENMHSIQHIILERKCNQSGDMVQM